MAYERWQLGSYAFAINPNSYSEGLTYVGDNAVSLDGTVVSMPTVVEEQYNFGSTVWQGSPKVLSQVSVSNGSGVEIVSGNYYILNNNTHNIDEYNSNLSFIKSISLGVTYKTNAFDVAPNGVIYGTDGSNLYTVSGGTTTFKNMGSSFSGQAQGMKYNNNNLWFATSSNMLYQTDMNLNVINSVSLPTIASNFLGYQGMTMIGDYLIVSFNSSDMTGAYHIDINTGNIVNAFSLPTYNPILDVAYDGKNFIFITQSGSQLITTNGNTVLVDLYTIEQNIKQNGYIYMIDDMNVKKQVTVNNYQIDRVDGYLTMYNITIQATKVDRG